MTFEGFGPKALDFFDRVKKDNTKTFFEAHRDDYNTHIRQPMEDLLGVAEAKYGTGRVTRPHRDVRFSANKEPYRINASMWAGTVGGVYLSLTLDGLEVGGGLYGPTRDQRERARTAIDAQPRAASTLNDIVETLASQGFEMAGPSLTTAPRGYDKENPNISLLRLKHFAALVTLPVAAPAAEIFETWSRVEPLIEWSEKYVGPALSWP
ncbi:MAG: DUF2461 domain-containing protein [Salinibacterium sp.]|nr:DUF2461 domain-containing protein [Salinibacterium sp.]